METRTKNSRKWLMVAFICCIAVAPSFAQEPPKKDLLQEFFFPPELVMKYQHEVQLKNEQKESIISSVEETQKKFNRLQWNMKNEVTILEKLLAENSINEAKVLEQLDKVLDQERQIKKTQISLMVRIKNVLTDEQKAKLTALRRKDG
jgi:Spy/CpxP family protein refolding chaperone